MQDKYMEIIYNKNYLLFIYLVFNKCKTMKFIKYTNVNSMYFIKLYKKLIFTFFVQ